MLAKITPYRCAKCGSGNVVPYTNGEKTAFSFRNLQKQAKATEYRCPDCHSHLPYSMNAGDKAAADSMVLFGGDERTTAEFLRKYRNLEIDPVLHMICPNP